MQHSDKAKGVLSLKMLYGFIRLDCGRDSS
jgi:hypothetical protein